VETMEIPENRGVTSFRHTGRISLDTFGEVKRGHGDGYRGRRHLPSGLYLPGGMRNSVSVRLFV
jgi:hypothetical protein